MNTKFLKTLDIKIESTQQRLFQVGEQIKRQIDRVNHFLETDSYINSLGELQSLGVSYDVTCAQLATLMDTRKEYLKEQENDNDG